MECEMSEIGMVSVTVMAVSAWCARYGCWSGRDEQGR